MELKIRVEEDKSISYMDNKLDQTYEFDQTICINGFRLLINDELIIKKRLEKLKQLTPYDSFVFLKMMKLSTINPDQGTYKVCLLIRSLYFNFKYEQVGLTPLDAYLGVEANAFKEIANWKERRFAS